MLAIVRIALSRPYTFVVLAILPAGTEKVGKFEYTVELNVSPKLI
ncbi:MAG: hypothetical protein QOG73_3405, partial [Acetobacteraceae bacterium]|nr:hypothetical protein [Acetobacteraceae bacterium]